MFLFVFGVFLGAAGSQLGSYLVQHQRSLTPATLSLYCVQVCKAMAYLEGLNMVHR